MITLRTSNRDVLCQLSEDGFPYQSFRDGTFSLSRVCWPESTHLPSLGEMLSGQASTNVQVEGVVTTSNYFASMNSMGLVAANANLAGSTWEEVKLKEANLSGSNLEHSIFDKVSFDRSQLSFCTLHNSNLRRNSEWLNCDFTSVLLTLVTITDSVFRGGSLNRADFHRSRLKLVELESLSAEESLWKGVQVNRCGFKEINFTKSYWCQSNLENIPLTRCVFSHASFKEVVFMNCVFRGCAFSSTLFDRCKFYDCRFTDSLMEETPNVIRSEWLAGFDPPNWFVSRNPEESPRLFGTPRSRIP